MSSDTQVPDPRSARDREVRRVLWQILVLNIAVAVAKLVFGYLAGAVSMLADGLHSLLDGASNIVGLVGLHIAAQGPDEDHPYGHRKFEAIASVGISMFLFLSATEVLREVVASLGSEHEVNPTPVTFVVMIVTLVVNVFVTRYESRAGRRLNSGILLADAKHTQSDVLVTVGVIVSLVAARLAFPSIDIIAALVIVGFILYSGFQIVLAAFQVLADAQAVDPSKVEELAMGASSVTHAHRVRSRGVPGDVHVDLHIHVPPEMTTREAHEAAHDVADRIKRELDGVTDVVVHVEPEGHHEDD